MSASVLVLDNLAKRFGGGWLRGRGGVHGRPAKLEVFARLMAQPADR